MMVMLCKLFARRALCAPLFFSCVCVMAYIWIVPKITKLGAYSTGRREKYTHCVNAPSRQEPSALKVHTNTSIKEKEVEAIAKVHGAKINELLFVVGVPSIKRPGGTTYLAQTLDHIVHKREKFDSVIFLVYLAELDEEWRKNMTEMVVSKFVDEVGKGLIRIIHPPDDLYPDWDKGMKVTLGDPRHQVQWRSKQNLDQAYLMEYAYKMNPRYYLGIEDDVSAVDNYLSIIFQHAESVWRDDFLFISYCKWGAIGKLFSSKMLPTVSTYLKALWNYKPLDWLYWDLKRTMACRYPLTNCEREAASVVMDYKEELFDHKGKVSSLDRSKS